MSRSYTFSPPKRVKGLLYFFLVFILNQLWARRSIVVHQWTAKQFWVDRQSFRQEENTIYCLKKVQINKLNVYLQFKLNCDVCYTYESLLYIFPIIKLN
jgi:hypothetical protein